mgnify:FL=1
MIFTSLPLAGGHTITDQLSGDFDSLGSLISTLLPYVFTLTGLILFFVIIGAGFTMFTSAGNPDKTKKAGQQLTFGLIGFFVVFAAYWISQLLENIFGVSILGS